MGIFDTILIIILAGFIFYGLFFGLIRTLGLLVALAAGIWVASLYYLTVYPWVEGLFFGFDNIGRVVVYILLFSLVNRLVGFGFALLDKTFNVISIIPFLKTINRLAGAILGFVLGSLIMGLTIYLAAKYSLLPSFLENWINASKIVPFLLNSVQVILPLLPEMLKKLQGLM